MGFSKRWKASLKFSKGMAYLEKREYDKAKPFLEEAYSLNSKDHFIVLNLSILYFYEGNYPLAWEKIEEAISLSPKNPVGYLYKAFIGLKLDKLEEVKEALKKTLGIDPKNPYANYLEALLYLKERKIDKASDKMVQYILFNKVETLSRLLLAAEIFLEEKSRELLRQNTENVKDNLERKNEIYQDFLSGKEFEAAEKAYEIVRKKGEDYVLGRILLAAEVFLQNEDLES